MFIIEAANMYLLNPKPVLQWAFWVVQRDFLDLKSQEQI